MIDEQKQNRNPEPILIGEIGLSHEGSLGIALNMVKNAKESGLDAIKFQMHDAGAESTSFETFRVPAFPQDVSRSAYWERTSFTEEQWVHIIEYCASLQIQFLCTPFSVDSAVKLKNLGCDWIKIGSGDANNFELIEYCKTHFEKVLVSTGMSFEIEIESLVDYFQGSLSKLVLMHCVSMYPTPLEKLGMSYVAELKKHGVELGVSDHTGNKHAIMVGITQNISFLEFHLAYSRSQFGPDASSSITFEEATEIASFRNSWSLLSKSKFSRDEVSASLQHIRVLFGRSLALRKPLKKGEMVLESNLTSKKPGGHLEWNKRYEIVGKRALKDIDTTTPLENSFFE